MNLNLNQPQMIYGLKVMISPDHPKMQLSEKVKEVLKPEDVKKFNAWLLEFFGTTNLVKDGDYILDKINNCIHMNQRTFNMIRSHYPF